LRRGRDPDAKRVRARLNLIEHSAQNADQASLQRCIGTGHRQCAD
jgi:hypothetical protein